MSLHEIAPGTYRADAPVPVYGEWKAMLRLQTGSAVLAVPVYLPEDSAIPAAEVPATPHFTRSFVLDREVLQRESTGGAAWLQGVASAVMLVIAIAWMVVLALALVRMDRTSAGSVVTG